MRLFSPPLLQTISILTTTHLDHHHHHHHHATAIYLSIRPAACVTNCSVRPGCGGDDDFYRDGANGYVGRAIVHELLLEQQQQNNNKPGASEQSIFCLVRAQRVAEETAYWKQVLSEQPREAAATVACSGLQVLPYDMLDGGTTLRAALDQCNSSSNNSSDGDDSVCLYHVASVFGPTENHEETALQNVQGTCDVLETVHRWRDDDSSDNTHKACKAILTSSMAAVRGTGQAPSNGKFYTAADWNTNSVLGANWGASYQWSKMESEQRARQLAEKYNIPLVSLCPSFVFGPPYGGGESSSFSIQLVVNGPKANRPSNPDSWWTCEMSPPHTCGRDNPIVCERAV
jgi:hypothetical protein